MPTPRILQCLFVALALSAVLCCDSNSRPCTGQTGEKAKESIEQPANNGKRKEAAVIPDHKHDTFASRASKMGDSHVSARAKSRDLPVKATRGPTDSGDAQKGGDTPRKERKGRLTVSQLVDKVFNFYNWASRNIEEEHKPTRVGGRAAGSRPVQRAPLPGMLAVDFLRNAHAQSDNRIVYDINEEPYMDDPEEGREEEEPFEWYDDEDLRKRNERYTLYDLAQIVLNSGGKLIENSIGAQYVYHVVAAIVLAIWLINVVLFVGLWQVPKLHSTMKIRPSLGDRGKPLAPDIRSGSSPRTAKIAVKTRSRRRSRSSPCNPWQSDSTIATVTVFPDGESLDGATTGSDNVESEDAFRDKKGRSRRVVVAIDSNNRSPKIRANKGFKPQRPTCEHNQSQRPTCEHNQSALTVFDLEDRSKLPTKIVDLLACRRDSSCIHDHDRCRVVNNKLYIHTKPPCGAHTIRHRPSSPVRIAGLHESPTRQKHTKKVTFSPIVRPRSPSRSPPLQSMSPVTESIPTENALSMPPPPRGYHVRIDPSSPDSTSAFEEEESTWTQTDADSNKEATQERRLPIKEMKNDFQKALRSSPQRLAESLTNQLKKFGFNTGRSEPDNKTNTQVQDIKSVVSKENGEGAFGDSIQKDSPDAVSGQDTQNMHVKYSEGMFVRLLRSASSNNSAVTNPEYSAGMALNRGSAQTLRKKNKPVQAQAAQHNRTRLRQTRRGVENANNNSNKFDFSEAIFLNTNTNANSGSESLHFDQKNLKVELNLSSNPPSVNQPDVATSRPEDTPAEAATDAEVTQGQLATCNAAELNTLDQKSAPVDNQGAQGGDIKEKPVLSESEPDGWEAKRHTIMQACNQAIKNRLQRQEVEDDESRDLTTSDSLPSRQSSEARKRRKMKTTESVYVKFKTSLSKKTTTTTTVKEVKQTSSGGNSKSLMLENDHQNALCISSQSSDQSLSVPQPRHTRIVKCGDLETPIRKRKLSSDTEVELLHQSDSSKHQSGASKSGKDIVVKDRQLAIKEAIGVDVSSAVEDHSKDAEKPSVTNVSQCSPQQKATAGNGENIGECDKLSEKASATTVIYVKEPPKASKKKDKVPSSVTTDIDETVSNTGEKQELTKSSGHSENSQKESTTLPESQSKERSKRRSKSHSSRHSSSKKMSDLKITSPKQLETTDSAVTPTTVEQPQSDTSLSNVVQKSKSPEASLSKIGRHSRRCHSSPPDCRKKKSSSKKKCSLTLGEPSESGGSKRIHKGRKRSSDKKKKPKAFRGERLRKTGSTSSASSDKKRKSQTTASSISIDSVECGASGTVEMSPPQSARSDKEKSKSLTQVTSTDKKGVQKPQKLHPKGNAKEMASSEKLSLPSPQVAKPVVPELKADTQSHVTETAPTSEKPIHKGSARILERNQAAGRDLQKAENGWNSSVYQTDTVKTKASVVRKRPVFRRTKLKYFLVKAKDMNDASVKREAQKSTKETLKLMTKESPKVQVEAKKSQEAPSDQDLKSEGQDLSLRGQGKTVQFSESIEKMETIKQHEVLEEVESADEQAHENHVRDNASDGSLGDVFISDNFDLVREMVDEEEEEEKQEEPHAEQETKASTQEKSASPKRHRRPVWLKKASNKPIEEIVVMQATPMTPKQNVSPQRFEKRRDSSLEEILRSKRCNIQVTNPLHLAGTSPKADQANLKTKVAYTTMLKNIFEALPLKKPVRLLIAQVGSPVDIKEVTEGSSVDAADYAKALRYTANPKRAVAAGAPSSGASGLAGKRKKGAADGRVSGLSCRVGKPSLGESGSVRSLVSVDSEHMDRHQLTPNCSFSTDLDEVAVYRQRPTHSAPTSRGARVVQRKKEKRPGAAVGRSGGHTWQLMGGPANVHDQDPAGLSELPDMHVAGDMSASVLNLSLSWVMQEFFNRFTFLNPRRPCRPIYRPSPEHSLDPAPKQQSFGAV